jgi:hypothetical protein
MIVDMTMRTDITMNEHALLMAVRQLRDAEAAQAETAATLVRAENDNVDAEWELDDAQAAYESALEEVKLPETYDWAAALRRELAGMDREETTRYATNGAGETTLVGTNRGAGGHYGLGEPDRYGYLHD